MSYSFVANFSTIPGAHIVQKVEIMLNSTCSRGIGAVSRGNDHWVETLWRGVVLSHDTRIYLPAAA